MAWTFAGIVAGVLLVLVCAVALVILETPRVRAALPAEPVRVAALAPSPVRCVPGP
ncbi:hypothetical protein [Arsenicitalea aurantiaca]|uniref:hypothetical protein n=1 Tax=Arsenicitalea aurantiaca TaxID=1783274 RepID=UPI0013159520|nr:hypothetical protein [Arsenicitalea aurantiaca]